jgi:hypothetical protein
MRVQQTVTETDSHRAAKDQALAVSIAAKAQDRFSGAIV